jgi:hypothetical protein
MIDILCGEAQGKGVPQYCTSGSHTSFHVQYPGQNVGDELTVRRIPNKPFRVQHSHEPPRNAANPHKSAATCSASRQIPPSTKENINFGPSAEQSEKGAVNHHRPTLIC